MCVCVYIYYAYHIPPGWKEFVSALLRGGFAEVCQQCSLNLPFCRRICFWAARDIARDGPGDTAGGRHAGSAVCEDQRQHFPDDM